MDKNKVLLFAVLTIFVVGMVMAPASAGVYDKVYSYKKWKTVKLTSFKVKKSWSKNKRDKIINQKYKKANKKAKKLNNKYSKKGWTYEGTYWDWNVGSSKVSYKYYVQFSKTQYYSP